MNEYSISASVAAVMLLAVVGLALFLLSRLSGAWGRVPYPLFQVMYRLGIGRDVRAQMKDAEFDLALVNCEQCLHANACNAWLQGRAPREAFLSVCPNARLIARLNADPTQRA